MLTASWTERNVSSDATARLPTSPHLRWVSHFGLGRNRQWCVVYVYVVLAWTLTLLYRSVAWTRCYSGGQEGNRSLRVFFVQIQFARSSNGTLSFATVSIVTHVITRFCSRMQRNNDRIGYNFQRFDEAVSL